MNRWNIDKALLIAICTLIVCVCINIATTWQLHRRSSIDDSRYSWIGDDHPAELPLRLDTVALTIEDTERYGIASELSWSEWKSLDTFPRGHGFVRLGPNKREFGVSMFHQMHCLNILRQSVIGTDGYPNGHTHHCLNFMRQAVLCQSDITLDELNVVDNGTVIGTNGVGMTHICRDWTQVFDFITSNQNSWPAGQSA